MHDALLVRGGEPCRHPVEDRQRFLLRQRALALHPFRGGLAAHELHHQVVQAVPLLHVHHAHDVLVRDAGGEPRLAFEALDEVAFFLEERWLQALHRHVEVELEVPPAVDRPHAAGADLGVEHCGLQHLEALDHRRVAQQRVGEQLLPRLLGGEPSGFFGRGNGIVGGGHEGTRARGLGRWLLRGGTIPAGLPGTQQRGDGEPQSGVPEAQGATKRVLRSRGCRVDRSEAEREPSRRPGAAAKAAARHAPGGRLAVPSRHLRRSLATRARRAVRAAASPRSATTCAHRQLAARPHRGRGR